jgi:hypothetical protein
MERGWSRSQAGDAVAGWSAQVSVVIAECGCHGWWGDVPRGSWGVFLLLLLSKSFQIHVSSFLILQLLLCPCGYSETTEHPRVWNRLFYAQGLRGPFQEIMMSCPAAMAAFSRASPWRCVGICTRPLQHTGTRLLPHWSPVFLARWKGNRINGDRVNLSKELFHLLAI